MAILVRNVSQAEHVKELKIPTRPDGSFYRYELICDGGWSRVYDDTTQGLLGHLIPGYIGLNDEQKLTARIRHAVDSQVRLQAQLNAFFAATERTAAEDAILNGPRHIQPDISQWDCAVPLVVIDAFYQPYTHLPRPVSGIADVAMPPNVWWLRPSSTESEYLASLHETSIVDLHVSKEEAI